MAFHRMMTVLFGLMLTTNNVAVAAEAWSTGKIQSPADAGTVSPREVIVVKTIERQKPMVAVRSLAEGSRWWVQDEGQFRGPSRYEVTVTFGNAQTPAGTCFQVTVLEASDSASARSIQPGQAWENLPPGISHAHVITVFTGAANAAAKRDLNEGDADLAAELVSPKPGVSARRIQNVTWQLQEPIAKHRNQNHRMLVRVDSENSPWWVQESLRLSSDGKRLSGTARIGNANTDAGTQFLLMLVRPRNSSTGEPLLTGDVLTDTSELHCSPTFHLKSR